MAAAPASAETLEQLDALSDLAADVARGLAAARDLAARGAYLDALATLERVLANFPTSREALLTHATYLCAIDDRQGGLVELGLLRERDYDAAALADARAACNTTARPSSPAAPAATPAPASTSSTSPATAPRANARPDPKVN
jgi:hypothetical protein